MSHTKSDTINLVFLKSLNHLLLLFVMNPFPHVNDDLTENNPHFTSKLNLPRNLTSGVFLKIFVYIQNHTIV